MIDLIDGRLARLLPGGLLRLHQVTRRVRELAASESVRSLGGRAHPLDHPDSLVNRFHNRYFGARGLIWNPKAALLNDSSEASNSATCSTETGRMGEFTGQSSGRSFGRRRGITPIAGRPTSAARRMPTTLHLYERCVVGTVNAEAARDGQEPRHC